MKRILFVILLLLLQVEISSAQETLVNSSEKTIVLDTLSDKTPLSLDRERITDFKENPDFNYDPPEEADNWWTQFKSWLSDLWNNFWAWVARVWQSFWEWILPEGQGSPFWGFVINVLPYIILAVFVGFIIWLFFRLNPGAKLMQGKEKPDVFFTEEEEIIKSKNIEKLIKKAISKGNFRLAVRYYYLLILKRLKEAELIEYEFDKTNSDYIAEITSENLNNRFKKATNLYDYIWYGNFTVTQVDFNKAERTFKELESKIPKAV